jgi:hypothetical protein
VIGKEGSVVEELLGPIRDGVGGEDFLILRQAVGLGPAQPPQDAQADPVGIAAVDGQDPWPQADPFRAAGARRGSAAAEVEQVVRGWGIRLGG